MFAPDTLLYAQSFRVIIFPSCAASFARTQASKEHQSNCGLSLQLRAFVDVLSPPEHVEYCDYLIGRARVRFSGRGCFPWNDRSLYRVNSVKHSEVFSVS